MEIVEFPLDKSLKPNEEWAHSSISHAVTCPICDYDYVSGGNIRTISGDDSYAASWQGRGDLTVLHFKGECQHEWELCFGTHKGKTYAFCRTLTDKT